MLYNFDKKQKAYERLKSLIGFKDKYDCTENNNRIYHTNLTFVSISNEYIGGKCCDEEEIAILIFDSSISINIRAISWQFINVKSEKEILDFINDFIEESKSLEAKYFVTFE